MQTLIDDPVFYGLLMNDGENTNSSYNHTDSSTTVSNSPSVQTPGSQVPLFAYPQNLNDNKVFLPLEPQVNIQQANHYEFQLPLPQYPAIRYHLQNLQTPYIPQQQQQPQYPIAQVSQPSQSETPSYDSSVFSDQISLTDSMESVQLNNRSKVDEFFMREIPLQISSEMSTKSDESSNLPSLDSENVSPKSTPGSSTVSTSQKRFHKFYTSTTHSDKFSITKSSSSLTHKCPFCQRQFKNKSYLSRHLKKHDTVKDYKCPFFSEKHTKCHHMNGEFSRKDTFKAHLKSIHFIYPIGVAKSNRNSSSGRCAGCFKEYSNNNEWIVDHIDSEECPAFAKYKDEE